MNESRLEALIVIESNRNDLPTNADIIERFRTWSKRCMKFGLQIWRYNWQISVWLQILLHSSIMLLCWSPRMEMVCGYNLKSKWPIFNSVAIYLLWGAGTLFSCPCNNGTVMINDILLLPTPYWYCIIFGGFERRISLNLAWKLAVYPSKLWREPQLPKNPLTPPISGEMTSLTWRPTLSQRVIWESTNPRTSTDTSS